MLPAPACRSGRLRNPGCIRVRPIPLHGKGGFAPLGKVVGKTGYVGPMQVCWGRAMCLVFQAQTPGLHLELCMQNMRCASANPGSASLPTEGPVSVSPCIFAGVTWLSSSSSALGARGTEITIEAPILRTNTSEFGLSPISLAKSAGMVNPNVPSTRRVNVLILFFLSNALC